ncbi:MAG: BREX system ATP-binding domain-containing protein [Bacillota bacterium]
MGPSLVEFLTGEYLEGYIKAGGSKIKLVMDDDGEGVTRLLRALCDAAAARGYLVGYLHAAAVAKINLFSNLYQAVVRELELPALVADYCRRVVTACGYEAGEVPAETDFVTWACERDGRVPEVLRRTVQERLERDLFRNRFINRSFATVILQLAADLLGARDKKLAGADKEILYAWLRGEEVLLRDMRRFHVFVRVDRYNARLMLRSLVELARLGGRTGLFVAVDGLEVLLAKKETGRPLYSKAARDEFYESVRQLIDGIDALSFLMIMLGFRRELAEDEYKGLHSYEALWLRIQHEVAGSRVNFFRDFLDLDAVATAAG